MRCNVTLGLLLCIVPLASLAAAQDQKDRGWKGKTILLKRPDIKFGYTDNAGRQVYHGTLDHLDYEVLADEGGWLKVSQLGKTGWFDKVHAVLVEDAVRYFTGVLSRDPRNEHALESRATAWQLKKEYGIAVKDWTELIRLYPDDAAYWSNRGNAYSMDKKFDQALSDYGEALRLKPDEAIHWDNRSIVYLDLKKWDKAIDDCSEAMRLSPDWDVPYSRRADAWLGLGKREKAVADLSEAIKLAPAKHIESDYWTRKADLLLALKQTDKALEGYDEAIRLDSESSWPVRRRASAWLMKKEYAKARKDFEEAIRLDPKNDYVFNAYAWALATQPEKQFRDSKKAIELARKACELTEWKSGSCVDTLAAAYAEAGDFKEAIRYQKQALADPEFDGRTGGEQRLRHYEAKRPWREHADGTPVD